MNIAFIVGCARSGTGIIGEFLAAHMNVLYLWEVHDIWEISSAHPDSSHRMEAKDVTPEVKNNIRAFFEDQLANNPSKKMLIEKCPRNALRIGFVKKIFPEAKIIHIVRDGRDDTCSVRPGLSKQWRHLKPPEWQQITTLPLIYRCAIAWRDVVTTTFGNLSNISYLQVKYEDLFESTSIIGQQLCQFLDIPYTEEMQAFENKIQDSTVNSYHAQIQTMWYVNDHSVRKGRWKRNLNLNEQNIVNDILGHSLIRLGYE